MQMEKVYKQWATKIISIFGVDNIIDCVPK